VGAEQIKREEKGDKKDHSPQHPTSTVQRRPPFPLFGQVHQTLKPLGLFPAKDLTLVVIDYWQVGAAFAADTVIRNVIGPALETPDISALGHSMDGRLRHGNRLVRGLLRRRFNGRLGFGFADWGFCLLSWR
jgi:hypothetical protein